MKKPETSLPEKSVVKSKKKSREEINELVNEVRSLERSVLLSNANLNNMVKVLKMSAPSSPHRVIYAAIHAQKRLLAHFAAKGATGKANVIGEDAVARELAVWLRKQSAAFVDRLLELLALDDVSLQIAAAKLLVELTVDASRELQHSSEVNIFDNVFFIRVVHGVFVNTEWSAVFAREFMKLVNEFDDLRYYLLKSLAKIIQQELSDVDRTRSTGSSRKRSRSNGEEGAPAGSGLSRLAENGFLLLEHLSSFPAKDANIANFLVDRTVIPASHQVLKATAHKRAFTDWILQYLQVPLTTALYKKVLMISQAKLMPNMTDPRLLMTFLTASYDQGGAISLLALHSVFTLIVRHNLDYPDFYKKLYQLLDRNVFHVKYRSRFFRLFHLFMQSTHIPAYLVAAFIKRMARLALYAPPAGILIVLPSIYNLIKQHPQCFPLIQRSGIDLRDDPFDMEEEDPSKCNALESSLWEIATLREHFFPNISAVSKIFWEKMTKPRYEMEDFLDYNYANLFDTVHLKALKKAPPMDYDIPAALFGSDSPVNAVFAMD